MNFFSRPDSETDPRRVASSAYKGKGKEAPIDKATGQECPVDVEESKEAESKRGLDEDGTWCGATKAQRRTGGRKEGIVGATDPRAYFTLFS